MEKLWKRNNRTSERTTEEKCGINGTLKELNPTEAWFSDAIKITRICAGTKAKKNMSRRKRCNKTVSTENVMVTHFLLLLSALTLTGHIPLKSLKPIENYIYTLLFIILLLLLLLWLVPSLLTFYWATQGYSMWLIFNFIASTEVNNLIMVEILFKWKILNPYNK